MKNRLIKLFVCLIAVVMACGIFTACSSSVEITTTDIYNANTTQELFKSYDNYFMQTLFYNKEGQVLQNKSSIVYINPTQKYVLQGETEYVMSADKVFGYNIKSFESTHFTKVLNLTGNPLKTAQDIVSKSTIDYEIITKAEMSGGVIGVTTTIPSAIAENLLKDDYVSGDIIKTYYKLNADTKSVISIDSIVIHADNSEWFYFQVDTTYNQPIPTAMANMISRANDTDCYKVSFVKVDKDSKTILDVENITVKKGDYANARLKTGYKLYTNQQCSTEYDGITTGNMILYYFYD